MSPVYPQPYGQPFEIVPPGISITAGVSIFTVSLAALAAQIPQQSTLEHVDANRPILFEIRSELQSDRISVGHLSLERIQSHFLVHLPRP